MKNPIFILTLILCFSCKNNSDEKSRLIEEKTNDIKTSSFNKEMDSLYNQGIYNGYAVAIVDTTGVIFNKGFGFADVKNKKKYTENTIINIASISKVFIGVALLKAQEMNLIDLDDPINKHLPFKIINPNFPNEIITIRHLATHTSSVVDTDIYMETDYINKDDKAIAENLNEKYGLYYKNPSKDWVPLSKYLQKLLDKNGAFYNASTFANRKPGEVYQYSNIGAALCALVIECAAKKPFNEFTKEYIFNPLKMSSTNWFFEEIDSAKYSKLYHDDQELPYYKILSYPDGGLITSSTDLSKFLLDLIKGYVGKGVALKSNSYKELFKSQLKETAFKDKENYNVGIFTEKELPYNVIGHSGGDPGTNTMMYFNTETKRGKIMILNTDSDKKGDMEVFWGIWNALDKY
jgi:CubicO group peptidase (beta-lactamase class C family)